MSWSQDLWLCGLARDLVFNLAYDLIRDLLTSSYLKQTNLIFIIIRFDIIDLSPL